MTNNFKYFVGNWKMFGETSSYKIIKNVDNYLKHSKIKINVIFCVPYTLLSFFSNKLKSSRIFMGAQNCHYLENSGPFTGSINSKMIKKTKAQYVIIGHSENRLEGDNDNIINQKIISALKNKLKIIFCIGENLKSKRKRSTKKILSNQIHRGLKNINSLKRILIAYEPVWAIGSGITPSIKELNSNIKFIKEKLNYKLKVKLNPKVLYGGSVDSYNIKKLKKINVLDGFLIGGASQSDKKFIDIIKNCYK